MFSKISSRELPHSSDAFVICNPHVIDIIIIYYACIENIYFLCKKMVLLKFLKSLYKKW